MVFLLLKFIEILCGGVTLSHLQFEQHNGHTVGLQKAFHSSNDIQHLPCEVQRRVTRDSATCSTSQTTTKSHTKDYQKKGLSKTHQTKSLKWVTIFKDDHQILPRMSLWVNLWHSTLKTPNPKVYPTVSGVYKSHPSDQQWQWTLQPLSYGHSLWYVHHPYDAKFHDLPPSRRHKWAKILVPSWQSFGSIWIFASKASHSFCWFLWYDVYTPWKGLYMLNFGGVMSVYPPTFKTFTLWGPT